MSADRARRGLLVGLAAACLVHVAGGAGPALAQDRGASSFQARIDELIEDGFAFPLGKTRTEITASLGRPLAAAVRRIPNQHRPSQTDELHELTYDGLRILLYRVTVDNRELVTDISLTGVGYRVKWGLGVGSTKEEVRRVLGPGFTALPAPESRLGSPAGGRPCGESDGNCTYRYAASEQTSHVYFSFRDGRVERLDWVFWVD